MIRVVIADDHPIVRSGLAALLSSATDIQVVGEASNGIEVLDLVAQTDPDVVLMDLRMPEMDGVGATTQIRSRHPRTQVLILTTYETDTDILRAVEAGATGYLLKDAAHEELLAGIRAAAAAETVLAPSVAARIVSRMRDKSETPTPRELEVLEAVARGLSNAEVGAELFISEATVKTHLLRIFTKLGVTDRTRAVTVALERGLIGPPA
jgi:DNA-binding NarL/FixJ family response regulator